MSIVSLKALPQRPQSSVEFSEMGYLIALEGVSAWALMEATKAILRGSLPHTFFPSPPEFRKECERVMQPVIDRYDREYKLKNSWAEDSKPLPPKTPEARARVSAAYAEFLEGHARASRTNAKTEAEELEEIRAKYDPALLAAVPDRIEPDQMRQIASKIKF